MNIDKAKQFIKEHPKLECLYMCIKAMGRNNLAQQMINVKRSPDNVFFHHYGEKNTDKIIYYILFDKDARFNGFCSLYRLTLMYLAYAESRNFIPVVYYDTNTLYYDESIKESQNAFEYYFSMTSDISHKDVLKSKNVIISKGADAGEFGTTNAYSVPELEIETLAVYRKKYIHLNPTVKSLFWSEMKSIISGDNTLGVHVRATDFNKGFNRHPIVVTPEEYLKKTKQVFKENNYDKVFLATDDEKIINLFESEFGEALFYYKDTYRSRDGEAIHYGNQKIEREHHKYLLGIEIIKDFYTLGYCAGLIAGNSNVSMCARIIKRSLDEEYKTLDIIDKGTNHNMHETRSRFNSMLKDDKRKRR